MSVAVYLCYNMVSLFTFSVHIDVVLKCTVTLCAGFLRSHV